MDDLIGGLFMLMVAAFVIAALIAVALAMVAASAIIGSLFVGLRGTGEFLVSLARRVRSRGGAARQPLAPEPAFELYVLGQLARDVRAAALDAWASMQGTRQITGQFASQHSEGATMPLGIGALVGGNLGTAIGVVIGALLTLPVLLVAGIIISGSWVLIGVLRGAEGVRRAVRRTSYECPVDHERFALPVYVCPGCGAEHRQLVPGRWGIIKRECQCGQVALPTMVLNGRQRVPQRCPSGHPMAGIIGYAELLRVALVAGPRAGKSTFLAAALHELDKVSQAGTLALAVVDDSRSDFDAALDNLANGRLPEKTQVGGNPALVAEVQGGGRSRALSLYDVAGESYVGDDEIRGLRFLEVPSGVVMLIDPLALDRLAADREEEIAAAEDRLRPSPVHPVRVLERMLGALHEAGAKVNKLPLAVVVGKTDALGIGAEIAALEQSAGDRAVPAWLETQGGGNFVRAVESEFETVGWFHASALGRVPDPADRTAFVPSGTADPILWLLRQNGVVPAPTKFVPTQAAERLSGAVAEDFPPISSRGWAWRAIPAGLVSLAVIGVIAVGVAAVIRSVSSGESGPDSAYANSSEDDGGSSSSSSGSGDTGGGYDDSDDDSTGELTEDPSSDPEELAAQINKAQEIVADPDSEEEDLEAAARLHQRATRLLRRHEDELHDETFAQLTPEATATMEATIAAADAVGTTVDPQKRFPKWKIVEPPRVKKLLAYYRAAEDEFGVPWQYLAAIHFTETKVGRIRGDSTAGAQGPMQFIPATWARYGGGGDVTSPRDSIMAAARMLAANGAPDDMDSALYRYNPSRGYVKAMKLYAELMEADERAYYGLYHWQVFYKHVRGYYVLPEGYPSARPEALPD